MNEILENQINFLPDEEILYRLQLQIQARQIDQQRRKDEVAAQFQKYEDQIKHLFVTLNLLSKRLWILINSESYIDYYDTLKYHVDYKKIEVGQVFQKITNYLLTPKMDINSMLNLCESNSKHLQLSQFVYLLSLFCYIYSNEMASLFVDFFLQVTSDKIEAFTQCFLVNPNIQIYFKTSIKPVFAQFRKNQRKENSFKSLLNSLVKFSPLIPKFFIKVLKKSDSRGLIFYKLLKIFLSYFDAFGIASSEINLYYKTQIKGLSKQSRRYYINGQFDDFILNALLSKENIQKNCSFVPCEYSLKKNFPYLYRPFILVDKMSLSNLNLNSDFLFVYLTKSQEEVENEQNNNNSIQDQTIFDEMIEINKITKSSNFESSMIYITKSSSDLNEMNESISNSNSMQNANSNIPSESNIALENQRIVKVISRDNDIESQGNWKTARKLFLQIAKRFLSKANLVKIPINRQNDYDFKDTSEIGKRTISLFERIAELSSIFKDPDLEIEIDKLQIILNKYPMSVNELASLFEENDLSTVIDESKSIQNILPQKDNIKKFDVDEENFYIENENDGLSDSILSSLSSNPLFALSLYEKQYMMLSKILILLDSTLKNLYESAVFRIILKNSNLNDSNQPASNFISNPSTFIGLYRKEIIRLQKESSTAKLFDQTNQSKSPSSTSLSSSSSLSLINPFEVAYKSLFLITIYDAGVYNKKEYPEFTKKYDKQLLKILSNEEGRRAFLSSSDPDKSIKVFYDHPDKLQPFIDQLKIVFLSKSSALKNEDSDDKVSYLSSIDVLDSTDTLDSMNSIDANTNSRSENKKDSSTTKVILGSMISNMDRAVMILTEILNTNGKKESGMDQYLPLTILGIAYASPPNIHSVYFFLKSFVVPILEDNNSSTFSNHDKFNLMLLHSALNTFTKSQK